MNKLDKNQSEKDNDLVKADSFVSFADPQLSETDIRQRIPVFVNSFNQLFYLRDTVEWFARHGFQNITVLDNQSTFPPLLEYLKSDDCLSIAHVVRLAENMGPRRALEWAANDPATDAGFVFTDPDLKLPEPPADNMLKEMFAAGLRHKCPKVGLALSLEPELVNLEMAWQGNKTVGRFEGKYWKNLAETDVYRAAIDTTFFVFVPSSRSGQRFNSIKAPQYKIPALRFAGDGYVAIHRPWLKAERPPEAESSFYHGSAAKHSTLVKTQKASSTADDQSITATRIEAMMPWPARRFIRGRLMSLLLDGIAEQCSDSTTVVQIGAHDGIMADPVQKHLAEQDWRAILIEPHPVYFSELARLYKGNEKIETINCGVSSQPGKMELFHLNEAARGKYSKGARGCASLNRQRMFDALERVNAKRGMTTDEDDIAVTTVTLRRLDSILSDRGITSVDILVVDVEGHEVHVLNSVELGELDLKLAIIECNGPDVAFEAQLTEKLHSAGLSVFRLGDDLVGFREGTLKVPFEMLLPVAGLPLM